MQLNLYSSKGKKLNKKITLDDSVFKSKVSRKMMSFAVYVYLSNKRQATAHTKTRGEVRGGGVKPWRQKGTGRARHGSIRSPIWKGGGVVFGPRNERVYKKKITKKMKKQAIRSAFSTFMRDRAILVLEAAEMKEKGLTKQVLRLTEKLPVKKKVLYIQDGKQKDFYLGSRNLKKIDVLSVNEVNTYQLLNHDFIVLFKDSIDLIHKFWGQKKGKKEKIVVKREVKKDVKKTSRAKKVKSESFESLGLSARIIGSLEKAGIKTVKQLKDKINKGEKITGVGAKSMEDIKRILKLK